MSEELVNQLTLNFLISSNQLQKLNKKIKENTENNRKSDKEIYKERIQILFNDLLVDSPPDNIIQEVKTGFDFFVDKCIYYFKALDNNELLEKERTNILNNNDYINDDIDFEKEEREIESGNYKETQEEEDEDEEEDEEDEEEEEEEEEEHEGQKEDIQEVILKQTSNPLRDINVKEKYYKKYVKSEGVENIQQLPLDWFQNVRQDYKKNKIIPRKKEIIIDNQFSNYEKKKI
jgi:hypothetical protein